VGVAEVQGVAAQVGMVAAAVVDGRLAGRGRQADLSAWR
jgi:predicted carbohydrate-binding protein with CBM5 and CBM33 domain